MSTCSVGDYNDLTSHIEVHPDTNRKIQTIANEKGMDLQQLQTTLSSEKPLICAINDDEKTMTVQVNQQAEFMKLNQQTACENEITDNKIIPKKPSKSSNFAQRHQKNANNLKALDQKNDAAQKDKEYGRVVNEVATAAYFIPNYQSGSGAICNLSFCVLVQTDKVLQSVLQPAQYAKLPQIVYPTSNVLYNNDETKDESEEQDDEKGDDEYNQVSPDYGELMTRMKNYLVLGDMELLKKKLQSAEVYISRDVTAAISARLAPCSGYSTNYLYYLCKESIKLLYTNDKIQFVATEFGPIFLLQLGLDWSSDVEMYLIFVVNDISRYSEQFWQAIDFTSREGAMAALNLKESDFELLANPRIFTSNIYENAMLGFSAIDESLRRCRMVILIKMQKINFKVKELKIVFPYNEHHKDKEERSLKKDLKAKDFLKEVQNTVLDENFPCIPVLALGRIEFRFPMWFASDNNRVGFVGVDKDGNIKSILFGVNTLYFQHKLVGLSVNHKHAYTREQLLMIEGQIEYINRMITY